jgi:NAD(P)-dependent dehydrogenase (short-subunit alcohol dehydrogenase family)
MQTNWIPDLSGRTAVVTGASNGLGAVTASVLAAAGARVVLAVRNVAKGAEVARGIEGDTEVRPLDLGDLSSVRAFAASWSGDLDILVNNAGIMAVPRGKTVDGFEMQFGTNHLGHFALTNLLLPHLTDRVVTVSSGLHRLGGLDLDDLNWDTRTYRPMSAYAQSKVANLLFTLELQRRLAGRGLRALAAHPGVAKTGLDADLSAPLRALTKVSYVFTAQRKPEYGALPTLFAATQDLPGDSYIGPGGRSGEVPQLCGRTKVAADSAVARRLWEISAHLTGVSTTIA